MQRFITLFMTVLLLTTLLAPIQKTEPAVEETTVEEKTETLDPKIEAMIAWAVATAEDDSHGYSQYNRFGPSYDCSSFVCTALMEGGFELERYIFPSEMADILPEYGFVVYRKGETEPQRGDILVQPNVHVEICMGDGACVAAQSEYDGLPGDSTGHEIEYRTLADNYDCPFCRDEHYTYILRYEPPVEPIIIPPSERNIPCTQ